MGKSGPELAGSEFKVSYMSEEEKSAAMQYVSYDSESDLMNYFPDGGAIQEAAPVVAWWGDWHPTDGGWVPTPLEWIPTKEQADEWTAEIGSEYTEFTFASVQPIYGSAWKVHASPN